MHISLPIVFIASALEEFRHLPRAARWQAAHQLERLANGLPIEQWVPLPDISNVAQGIRLTETCELHAALLHGCVYVLNCFQRRPIQTCAHLVTSQHRHHRLLREITCLR